MTRSVKEWFNGLNPEAKRKVVVGGAVGFLVLGVIVFVFASDDGSKPGSGSGRKQKVQTSILTGRDPQKVGIEQLTASNKRQEALIENLQRQVQSLAQAQGGARPGPGGGSLPYPYANAPQGSEVVALPGALPDQGGKPGSTAGQVQSQGLNPVRANDKLVDAAIRTEPGSTQGSRGGRSAPTGAAGLPPPNIPGVTNNSDVYGTGNDQPVSADVPAPPPPKIKLRVLTPRQEQGSDAKDALQPAVFTQGSGGAAGGRNSLTALQRNAAREPEFYVPMGSILSGTLITGVDAPAAGSAAKKDPFPALFRVKHEGILPNSGLLDLRECFIVASAYGDLSSERVYMRAEGVSCQRSDGAIIEASIDAYASGSDGKAGIRGNVVEKTGQLIGRSLLSGFVGGLAKSFKPQQAQQVALNPKPGETVPFNYPSTDFVLGSGLMSGGAAAAERIATIYEDLARNIVPVIEIHAGIPVDFIMTRGATLRFKRTGEAAQGRPLQAQPGRNGANQMQGDGITTSVSGTLGGPFSVTPGPGTSTPPVAGAQQMSTITGARR